jgi:hypothetical protein
MTISLSSIGQISCTATSTDEHCGMADGTATVTSTDSCPSGFTYLWNTVPAKTTATVTGLPSGVFTVTVTCDTQTCIATTTVTNLPGPMVTISSVTNSVCSEPNGGATALASGLFPPFTLNWSNGQIGQNLVNVLAGIYHVTVTDSFYCQGYNSVTITDTPSPSCSICNIQNDTNGLGSGSITICVNGGTAPFTYLWSGGYQLGATTTNLTSGIYTVTVTDANGCTCTDAGTITNASSINETYDNINISIFPNPTTEKLTIDASQKATIEILNIQGQTIQQQQLQQGKTDIDISRLAKGVYILRLCSNDKTAVTKIVKE